MRPTRRTFPVASALLMALLGAGCLRSGAPPPEPPPPAAALATRPEPPEPPESIETEPPEAPEPPPPVPLRELAHRRGLTFPLREARIVVRKAEHRLDLLVSGEVLKSYRVALGCEKSGVSKATAGPKRRQGDRLTPEGVYRICERHAEGPYHLWLGLSYPNAEDARRGLADGLISAAQCKAIVQADEQRRKPSGETKLGGQIGIHGGGSRSDWTAGCVALENADVKEIWDSVPNGAEVRILP